MYVCAAKLKIGLVYGLQGHRFFIFEVLFIILNNQLKYLQVVYLMCTHPLTVCVNSISKLKKTSKKKFFFLNLKIHLELPFIHSEQKSQPKDLRGFSFIVLDHK